MTRYIREIATRILDRAGYAVVPKWRLEKLPMATYMRELFDLLKIGCVLDVGANVGQYRDFLRTHVGYQGQIISFEPIQKNATLLERRAESDSKWDIHPIALGDQNTELFLNVMEHDRFSSFLAPNNAPVPEFESINVIRERQMTKVRRLDDWASEEGCKYDLRRAYLKLDTQGFDINVLRGAKQLWPKIAAMQSEVSCLPIYEGSMPMPEAVRFFNEAGFDAGEMFTVSRDRALRAVEFDCILVNRNLAAA